MPPHKIAMWIFLFVAIVLLAKASTLPKSMRPKKSIPGLFCLLVAAFFWLV